MLGKCLQLIDNSKIIPRAQGGVAVLADLMSVRVTYISIKEDVIFPKMEQTNGNLNQHTDSFFSRQASRLFPQLERIDRFCCKHECARSTDRQTERKVGPRIGANGYASRGYRTPRIAGCFLHLTFGQA